MCVQAAVLQLALRPGTLQAAETGNVATQPTLPLTLPLKQAAALWQRVCTSLLSALTRPAAQLARAGSAAPATPQQQAAVVS
jgi:hypothetical protein